MAEGVSPNGVRAIEKVNLIFPPTFPLDSPLIYLRQNFDRTLAHVHPGLPDERPSPCIYDGKLQELLQQQGLAGILNQIVLWLENAALGRLIDPGQGWEPVRRDSLDDFIIADAAYLRSFVNRKEGYAFFRFDYLRYPIGEHVAYHGEIGRDRLKISAKIVGDVFTVGPIDQTTRSNFGKSLALLVWPGRLPCGKLVVADHYRPETITNISSLMERASEYGCSSPLQTALEWLKQCLSGFTAERPAPLTVVLCARRPFKVLGSESELELCPYIVEIGAPHLFSDGDRTRVRPVGHRHAITIPLLRTMAEGKPSREKQSWILLGAGSLGSKIAIHLARAGRAPSSIIDRANLSPHNAARHALLPTVGTMQMTWIGSKAAALADSIKSLGQVTESHVEDIVDITRNSSRARQLLSKKNFAIVNSTASLVAREALASVSANVPIPRVIETSLFAQGRVGLMSVEGPKRNPNTGDLISEAYALMRENKAVGDLVFTGSDALQRQTIGEGCGSATMVMSDSRISMLAAPMAEALTAMQRNGLPVDAGRLLLGTLAEDGLSQSWQSVDVAPYAVIEVNENPTWSIRISKRAHHKITTDVSQWPSVETGGILVGRFSEAAQTFYVVDVLPAPIDSTRSVHEFVLGKTGVRAALKSYSESAAYSLYCLGTWHSHLVSSGPSPIDQATAIAVGLARLMPSILLIHTPSGYRAALAQPPSRPKARNSR